jgi:isoleucyl-tRNA synthetase
MFEVLGAKSIANEEEETLKFWSDHKIFQKSIDIRINSPHFVFYEGPPTANGMPGIHHCLSRIYKDTVCRWQTMHGFRVDRKAGWDTHGLPVELEVEKQLGFSGKQEIEKFGIEAFVKKCKESVFKYESQWVRMSERIAFWLDFEHQYMTLKNDYIESLWWILKTASDKGLLYRGHKSVPYCPRCGTTLSSHEVAQGYEETKDPSIFVKMELVDEPGTYFLVWTTTPWTLPGNASVAVKKDSTYIKARKGDDILIMIQDLAQSVLEKDYEIIETFPGSSLVGKKYKPLYSFMKFEEKAHYAIAADFVSTTDGTGIVHIAPAFGADDLEVGKKNKLPLILTIDDAGQFLPEITPWAGRFVKDADVDIIMDLKTRGVLFKSGKITHTYPFCWRCDSPLLYFAKPSWYVKMSALRDNLIRNNEQITWYPNHIKDGRFGEWLREVKDWAISRERYWGTPLPIWVCEKCGKQTVVGSIKELKEKSDNCPDDIELHRPYVDDVTMTCECGGTMRRVPEVCDCWFDSGSMPYAQWHYPFENKEQFETHFPADFISEAIDQTRGWFYTLLAVSTILFDKPAYKSCICLELIVDENGQKMSKSRGNVVDPWLILNNQGADTLRWTIYTSSPPWTPTRIGINNATESFRGFTLLFRNVYNFFTMYANIDGFDPREKQVPLEKRHFLDRWIISRTHSLIKYIESEMKKYGITQATRKIQQFIDELANWYIRRSRRRFWKSESDTDKFGAYHTLYEVLTSLAGAIAPFEPFFAEKLYQSLVVPFYKDRPESIHLCDYPTPDEKKIDIELEKEMDFVRDVVSVGLKARKALKIKVRQPLSHITARVTEPYQKKAVSNFAELIREEVNVKDVEVSSKMETYLNIVVKPNLKTLGKRFGPRLNEVKEALSNVNGKVIMKDVVTGGSYKLELADGIHELTKDDVLIERENIEGFYVESDGDIEVMLSTIISPELKKEGLVREVIHAVQNLRKESGLAVDDKIRLSISGSNEVCEAVNTLKESLLKETLSVSLQSEPLQTSTKVSLEGEEVLIGLVLQQKGSSKMLQAEGMD